MTAGVALAGLAIADPPDRWAALGFAVDRDGELAAGEVRITLGIAPPGEGIVAWTLRGPPADGDVAGLVTRWATAPDAGSGSGSGDAERVPDAGGHRDAQRRGEAAVAEHPNRVTGIDHVVIAAPDLDAFAAAAAPCGLGFTRTRELRGRRIGFRRIGAAIMEVVEDPAASAPRFWGVTFTVAHRVDLDALAEPRRLVGRPHDALQPGRRIAAVSSEAGLSTQVAFMD